MKLEEGQIIALNSRLQGLAKTKYRYALIDKVGRTVDATFISENEVKDKQVLELKDENLNLTFCFVYTDIHLNGKN